MKCTKECHTVFHQTGGNHRTDCEMYESSASTGLLCLPETECARVETGPIQFGDDWPGIFLRGDDALIKAHYLRQAIKVVEDNKNLDHFQRLVLTSVLEGLASNLESCRASTIDQSQKE